MTTGNTAGTENTATSPIGTDFPLTYRKAFPARQDSSDCRAVFVIVEGTEPWKGMKRYVRETQMPHHFTVETRLHRAILTETVIIRKGTVYAFEHRCHSKPR